MRRTGWIVALALSAAAVRLVPLGWLHPLNWDEIEFFRATDWIRRGFVPYRDFWEHHTPLPWFLFAPFTALSKSTGVDAVLILRWAQIPVWIMTFWLMNLWMRRAGIEPFARWSAMTVALCSSFLMISAVEYRVDSTAAMIYVAGLVLAQRMQDNRWTAFAAGVVFCLAGFANLRLGPLLALTVLLLRVVEPNERKWGGNVRANWIFAGVIATLALAGGYFVATRSLLPFWQHVFVENFLGDRYAPGVPFSFPHRMIAPFGLRLLAAPSLFDWTVVDPAGIVLLLLGFAGLLWYGFRSFRRPDDFFVLAFLAAANLMFIAVMKYVYNYHFQIVAVLMLPFVAVMIARIGRPRIVVAILALCWCVNGFASIFRGKEQDRAYQDLIMREVHARTAPDARVWDGAGFALRRRPAYHFWFLPGLARDLVTHGYAEPYRAQTLLHDPPAAIIADYNLSMFMALDGQLTTAVLRHYIPVWRNLWMPGPNALLTPQRPIAVWLVPADGDYRLYASAEIGRHEWFRRPFYVGSYFGEGASRFEIHLPAPAGHPQLEWQLDGKPLDFTRGIAPLRKGQQLAVRMSSSEALGVILLPTADRVLVRQPADGVTLEAAAPRRTHIPRFD